MIKQVILVVLTAFTLGLVAETTVAIVEATNGVFPQVSDAIELGVCWGVVLAVFVAAVVKSVRERWW